jgi:hypothetical protein
MRASCRQSMKRLPSSWGYRASARRFFATDGQAFPLGPTKAVERQPREPFRNDAQGTEPMELVEVNANRSARLPGGQISLDDRE